MAADILRKSGVNIGKAFDFNNSADDVFKIGGDFGVLFKQLHCALEIINSAAA